MSSRLAESEVRKILGDGKLYQVTTFNGKLATIETSKREMYLLSSYDAYSSHGIIDVSDITESDIINQIKGIFGNEAKIIAYYNGYSEYNCHKDEFILSKLGPDIYGSRSVVTDLTVEYLVCMKGKKKPSIPKDVEKDDTTFLFNCD